MQVKPQLRDQSGGEEEHMLHIEYWEKELYMPDVTVCGNEEYVKKDLCSLNELTSGDMCMEYELRRENICRYLKELYDIEWADAYTVLIKKEGEEEPQRAIFTVLAPNIQLTMKLISDLENGHQKFYVDYLPSDRDLKWLDEHYELTLYMLDNRNAATVEKRMCAIPFRRIRRYCSCEDRISICMKGTKDYETFTTIMEVPNWYDGKYVCSFYRTERVFINPTSIKLERMPCVELILSEPSEMHDPVQQRKEIKKSHES
jgi:hypothetical protein